MPLAPQVLPGRAFQQVDRKSRLLFHWRAEDLSLNSFTGQAATFVRATAGGFVADAHGRWHDVAQQQPRFQQFDADGDAVRERPALMVEGQRTQQTTLWRSADDGIWVKNNLTVTPNVGIGPDGRQTSDLLLETVANASHQLNRDFAITAGERVAWGLAVAGVGRTKYKLRVMSDAGANQFEADFDTVTGLITPVANTGTGIIQNARMARLADGNWWLEIGGTVDPAAVLVTVRCFIRDDGGASVYVGDVTKGAHMTAMSFRRGEVYVGTPVDPATGTSNSDDLSWLLDTLDLRQHPNLTLYIEAHRPFWADATGAISADKRFARLGTAVPHIALQAQAAARTIEINVNTAGTDASATQALPAGNVLRICAQVRDIINGAKVKVSVGAGFSAESAAASAFAALGGTSSLQAGHASGVAGSHLDGGLYLIKLASGLYTPVQMQEAY